MNEPKRILVSVISDLTTDQRVQKFCNSLSKHGYSVKVYGRKLEVSPPFTAELYEYKRFKLWFNKGVFFYININLKFFFNLLFEKPNLLIANDLDTLLANYWVSKIKNIPLYYDSHEYFTEVPELVNRPWKRKIWEFLEKQLVPKLKYTSTVSENIVRKYNEKYHTNFKLIRNFPVYKMEKMFPKEDIIIYQGALNVGRGLEELIKSMPMVKGTLYIAGGGDIEDQLKELAHELNLNEKVIFLGRLSPIDLVEYTKRSKIGVSIEKAIGDSYRFALPNKVFDYLHCGTAVLYSNLIEVKNLIANIPIGEELMSYDSEILAKQLNEMLKSHQLVEWQRNAAILSTKYCWQNEEKQLIQLVKKALND